MPRRGSDGVEIAVKVDGLRELDRDLTRTGVKLSDLDFTAIANMGMRLAAEFAPKKTGRLARSIKANKSKNKAVVKAGGARVQYAAPINYGWPKRNIEGAGFMQRADEVLRKRVPRELEKQVKRIILRRRFGL